jgi:hypothetical protein
LHFRYDIQGQRRETIETEIVRQNDTEAGELVQNQGESSITESRCTEEFELNTVIPDPDVIGQWCDCAFNVFKRIWKCN